jgi:DNA primase
VEIQDIKKQLSLSEVVRHYGLKADKQNRLCCPFHADRTPSLQLYYKTHTAYCFSSNCPTHGKSMDVIDFIMYYEKCTKHEAIKKAGQIISPSAAPAATAKAGNEKALFFERMFTYFKNAVHNSKPAQEYIQGRCLDFRKTEVGYNAGQFHHGTRKDENLIAECLKYGLLLDLGLKARTGDTAYKPFGKWCLVFALRSTESEITGLYFRSTLQDKEQRHFYLRDRQGLYPGYPKAETRKLILTESIIDAASLLEQGEIKTRYEVLALYGTNGLTEEHQAAIRGLQQLEEIIFFLNGDEAGSKAVAKYAPMLKAAYPNLTITSVAVPEGEDVNSLLQGHSPELLHHLIDTRIALQSPIQSEIENLLAKETGFIFSNEKPVEKEKPVQPETLINSEQQPAQEPAAQAGTGLNTDNPYNLKYQGSQASYQVKGFRAEQPDSLKITLQITIP